jgi:DNA-binding IclR family transcriptional regulator
VNEEDVDWRLCHIIPEAAPIPVGDLAVASGLPPATVERSLARLEQYCLIERTGSSVRLLSFREALIRNQMKYEEDLPFFIENGVIREKKKDHAR